MTRSVLRVLFVAVSAVMAVSLIFVARDAQPTVGEVMPSCPRSGFDLRVESHAGPPDPSIQEWVDRNLADSRLDPRCYEIPAVDDGGVLGRFGLDGVSCKVLRENTDVEIRFVPGFPYPLRATWWCLTSAVDLAPEHFPTETPTTESVPIATTSVPPTTTTAPPSEPPIMLPVPTTWPAPSTPTFPTAPTFPTTLPVPPTASSSTTDPDQIEEGNMG